MDLGMREATAFAFETSRLGNSNVVEVILVYFWRENDRFADREV